MDALTPLHTPLAEPVRDVVPAKGSVMAPPAAPTSDQAAPPGAVAFVLDEESEGVMRQSFANLGIVDERIVRGGIDAAMDDLVKRGSPRLLVVDVSGIADPMGAIRRLSEVCDSSTEVVIVGERNDIVLYRDMKAAGVAEYFFKPLISTVMTRVLGDIATGTFNQRSPRTGKLVVVLGVRGGVGATTIATQAAWHLAEERQRRVLLLDLDLQSGDAALQLDVAPTNALSEALQHPERVDDLFLDRGVTEVADKFSLLAAFEPLSAVAGPSEDAVLQLVATLTRRYRVVLVDLPAAVALHHPKLLHTANTILLVSNGSLNSAREVARWRERIGPNTPDRTTLHVFNEKGADGALPEAEFDRALATVPDISIAYDRNVAKTSVLGSKALYGGAAMKRGMAALTRQLVGGEHETKRSLWNRIFG
jgi:pilus assembly protein CpaE